MTSSAGVCVGGGSWWAGAHLCMCLNSTCIEQTERLKYSYLKSLSVDIQICTSHIPYLLPFLQVELQPDEMLGLLKPRELATDYESISYSYGATLIKINVSCC